MMGALILAPLRGVTIRCFRETFAREIEAAGFSEVMTPFISAMPGVNPLNDRELRGDSLPGLRVTVQFIGKDPGALRDCLERIRSVGYSTADLNCGCPFPMVRNKGRGSGLLGDPETLRKMIATGCEVMGPGRFSIKARLGVERNDELLSLMPILNDFPIRFLTVHGRVAKQMYSGSCDMAAVEKICAVSKAPVVLNGDIPFPPERDGSTQLQRDIMVGRSFVRYLGSRDDAGDLLNRYAAASMKELGGSERAVLGRMKELVSYWNGLHRWRAKWALMKLCRTLDEFLSVAAPRRNPQIW